MGMYMRVRTSARLRMYIPAQMHIYEGARPRALPEGLGFPVEKIEDMSAGEAEEHIAALYGDELYGLELDGEVSGEGAMRCACSPVHDEVRGICDMLGWTSPASTGSRPGAPGCSGRARGCRTASTRASRSATSRGACAPCGPTALPVRKAPTRTAGPIGDRR